MPTTMGQLGGLRQVPQKSRFGSRNRPAPPWLIILYTLSLSSRWRFPPSSVQYAIHFSGFGLAFLLAASAASADSRVFIIANQADGYGVDQCLAKGEKCGAHAARPIASRGISPRLRPTGVSTPTRSPVRFPRRQELQPLPAATNTSPSPASAEPTSAAKSNAVPATPAPRKRRDAAQRSGYGKAPLAAPSVSEARAESS